MKLGEFDRHILRWEKVVLRANRSRNNIVLSCYHVITRPASQPIPVSRVIECSLCVEEARQRANRGGEALTYLQLPKALRRSYAELDAEATKAALEYCEGVLRFKPDDRPMDALNARVLGFIVPEPLENLRTFYRRAGCSVARYYQLFIK